MINKKNELGREPELLGLKDAVHVAIISVQAESPIKKGSMIQIKDGYLACQTSDRSKAFGVADPFSRQENNIRTGQNFWVLAFPSEVQQVSHVWENSKIDGIKQITQKAKKITNKYIESIANQIGVGYDFLMKAADDYMNSNCKAKIEVEKDQEFINSIYLDDFIYDFWSEWKEEVGHHFPNNGSECCPEYYYPEFPIKLVPKTNSITQK